MATHSSEHPADRHIREGKAFMENGYQDSLGGFGVPGHSLSHHVITVSDGLRSAKPEQDDALAYFGRCRCEEVFCLPDHFQSWLSRAIRLARNTYIASSGGEKMTLAHPDIGVFHSPPLEFNIACLKCGDTLAVVLQGLWSTKPPGVAVTMSVSTPLKTIVYRS